jgi:hypothetical protein
MWMTKFSGPAAAVLCAAGLAVAVPETAAAAPATLATRVAAEPPVRCLAGVRRVQATSRQTPSHRLSSVQSVWIAFTTTGSGPCPKNGGFASRS